MKTSYIKLTLDKNSFVDHTPTRVSVRRQNPDFTVEELLEMVHPMAISMGFTDDAWAQGVISYLQDRYDMKVINDSEV